MSNKSKDIDRKNCTCYFYDDVSNIKHLHPNRIKTDEKSNKNYLFYYIGYVTIKDSRYVKFKIVNPLYLITNKINGYFEEIKEINV